jgi:hypothetical protein
MICLAAGFALTVVGVVETSRQKNLYGAVLWALCAALCGAAMLWVGDQA